MKWDYVVVGAGPSGIYFAYEISKINPEKKVILIDRGKRVEQRRCPRDEYGVCTKCKPYCNISNGFSGAGAFSDGKISLYNPEDDDLYVGGNLHKYVGVNKAKELIDYTDSVYLKFGATTVVKGLENQAEISRIQKKAQNFGLELIRVPVRHVGTDESRNLFKKMQGYLEEKGVKLCMETEVEDLIIEDDSVKGVNCVYNGQKFQILGHKVVVGVGRAGANWLLKMCQKHNIHTDPGIIDIGVRYELSDSIMKDINKLLHEGKFIGKPAPFFDKVRTFCQNPSGFVTTEVYDQGITSVNGHSMKHEKSFNTNLAILVSLNLLNVGNPMEYSRNIARNVGILSQGGVIVQRLGDIKIGKRSWKADLANNKVVPSLESAIPGDLSLAIPYREMMDILGFIEMLNNVIPGFAEDDNLLYGPEVKFYSNKVKINDNFETSINGLYAIGDGCGLTRGLMMASASGVQLARNLS